MTNLELATHAQRVVNLLHSVKVKLPACPWWTYPEGILFLLDALMEALHLLRDHPLQLSHLLFRPAHSYSQSHHYKQTDSLCSVEDTKFYCSAGVIQADMAPE